MDVETDMGPLFPVLENKRKKIIRLCLNSCKKHLKILHARKEYVNHFDKDLQNIAIFREA